MSRFFTRERFGRPQFLAGLLLLAFLAQCLWLTAHSARHTQTADVFRVDEGLRQWSGVGIAGTPRQSPDSEVSSEYPPLVGFEANGGFDPNHSPMWYLIASAPVLVWPGSQQPDDSQYWGWLARAPYLFFGTVLGASLWYVARRLYGNAGGYIALALYCFSPAILRSASMWDVEPEIGAAWGAFGAVFTAIAVAHTLYAPREVVLWNWRRIVLLGLSLALAVGSQFSLIVVVPLALGFMLYVAPTRRAAALAIWGAACLLAFMLLLGSYFFHPGVLLASMRHADYRVTLHAFFMADAYRAALTHLLECGPALVIGLPVALIVFAVWKRARYFGNAAPLIVAAVFLLLGIGTPHLPVFYFLAVPFLFVLVAGIMADLLETPYRNVLLACIWGLLIASAIWNLIQLAAVRG